MAIVKRESAAISVAVAVQLAGLLQLSRLLEFGHRPHRLLRHRYLIRLPLMKICSRCDILPSCMHEGHDASQLAVFDENLQPNYTA